MTGDAKRKLIALRNEFKKLGGPMAVKAQREMKKLQREVKLLGGATKKTTKIFTKFTNGIAIGNIMAAAATKVMATFKKSIENLEKSIIAAAATAARISALNRVFQFTGKNIGYTAKQLDAYKNALIESGIAEKEALGALQRGVQARFSLNKVLVLGRIAQNAAFVAGVQSSRAHIDLMDAILKQRPILLKQFGILVNLVNVYGKAASELNKTRNSLTATEKRTALFNAVVEQATSISGAYVEGMKEVGKRLTSLPRHVQAAQNAMGKGFLPVMGDLVNMMEASQKSIRIAFDEFNRARELPIKEVDDFKNAVKEISNVLTPMIRGTLIFVQSLITAVSGIKIVFASVAAALKLTLVLTDMLATGGKNYDALMKNIAEGMTGASKNLSNQIEILKELFKNIFADVPPPPKIIIPEETIAEINKTFKIEKLRLKAIGDLRDLHHEAQIANLSEFESEKHKIAYKYTRQIELMMENHNLNIIEKLNARAFMQTILESQLTEAIKEENKRRQEDWMKNNEVIMAGLNSLNSFFGGFTSAIMNRGNIIKEAFQSMGKAILYAFGQIAANAIKKFIIGMAITKVALTAEIITVNKLTASYWALAAAKTAAGAAGGGPFGIIGSFLPFDDPVNDAALIKEHRQIGKLIAKGIAEGTKSVISTTTTIEPTVHIEAPIYISGTSDAEGIADKIARKIELLRDSYTTKILTESSGITR